MKLFFKKSTLVLFFLSFTFLLLGNTHSGNLPNTTITRIPVWVFLETIPGSKTENARASMPPKNSLKKVSSFLLSGLVFGWDFEYVPYDKRRNVKEFFEIKPKYKIEIDDQFLNITNLTPAYPYLYCYAEYTSDNLVTKRQETWASVTYKTVQGKGTGERSDEVQGIFNAYINATKDAIRRYAQTLTKNKPKEIRGQILIKNNPRLFMTSGRFHASLEMYIHITEIISYELF